MWGFSGSPMVVEGHLIVYVGGSDDNGLIAVNSLDGKTIWGLCLHG